MTKEKTEQETRSIGTEQQQNKELLRLKTGYNQHASYTQMNASPSTAKVFSITSSQESR
jgi:hypothetical protein